MERITVLLIGLLIGGHTALAQCVVSKDVYGQIVTTCEVYESGLSTAPSHKQETYLGSPFLTYPAWQMGTVQIEPGGKEVACELAYDLVANEVQCHFEANSPLSRLTPYAFTIDGLTFVRQLSDLPGGLAKRYTTVLYAGPTKLTKSIISRLVPTLTTNGYDKSSVFQGHYQQKETYYIQKGDAQPELTSLDEASLLKTLHGRSTPLATNAPTRQLPADEVIKMLMNYDSVSAIANLSKPALSTDALFNQQLTRELSYPNQAWLAGVYGRVYVGFTVNEQGQLGELVTLSPENIGYGLDQAVKRALKQVGTLKPAYQGRYALPVAFTYDHTQDTRDAYVPVNVLAPERYVDRILLTEFVVPIKVAKPVPTIREVWGFYK
ncbi:energy transducer TonB [Fibrella forsythiae]|uniref:TonB family protein n=1 Tax=Fibrella forsythiae TaxID=2817061 RepID=A0ABS3JEJ9_9BACT|nr:TonB family protein [Fibrella forsythiae]MBO0948430.1 TonB family protein [Fibrella forsythiae]